MKFYLEVEIEVEDNQWNVETLLDWLYRAAVTIDAGDVKFDNACVDRVSAGHF